MSETTKSGVDLIAAERQRQITQHGWTPEHDDAHDQEELAAAAVHYVLPEWDYAQHGDEFWPCTWDARWDQKDEDDRITQLAKAGALIAAEIDRLQRAAAVPSAREAREI